MEKKLDMARWQREKDLLQKQIHTESNTVEYKNKYLRIGKHLKKQEKSDTYDVSENITPQKRHTPNHPTPKVPAEKKPNKNRLVLISTDLKGDHIITSYWKKSDNNVVHYILL